MNITNRERLILLNLIPDIGSNRLRRLLDAFGNIERIFSASTQELELVEGIGHTIAQHIFSGCKNERLLKQELSIAKSEGADIITLEDESYPKRLRNIYDPPLALYVKGSLDIADEVSVGIVGSRRASLYGLHSAERLSADLAMRGVSVVSGLARGIDAAAHRGALKVGGRTIAVLGNGLSRIYPPEHRELAGHIRGCGAIISEYPMGSAPMPYNFPRRNRIISGLSAGVVVVEASSKSGALITADCALEQGREVFAIPGPVTSVTSQGTHKLLKQGASLVTSVEDIIEELNLLQEPINPRSASDADAVDGVQVSLSAIENRILSCVHESKPSHIEMISSSSGASVSEVSAALLQLELKRMIRHLPGKWFIRLSNS